MTSPGLAAPGGAVGAGPHVADAGLPRLRYARLAVPPALMFVIALSGISGASFWRDEAATLSAVRRPLPGLWHFLATTDVVHGGYYLCMWPVAHLLGTGELGMRLPSVVAVAAAAAGVAAIAARLVSERAGLAAGLLFAVFPVASRYGQEARSYAFVMALTALASYLLCRAMSTGGRTRRWWVAYAAVLAVTGWMNLMALLIIPAHGLTVAMAERKFLCWQWAVSVATTLLAVVPLLVLSWPQRHGTERFLAITSVSAVADMPGRLTGSWEVLAVALLLAVAALYSSGRKDTLRLLGGPGSPVTRLCLPWLLAPPVLLLAAGSFVPLYDPRYILFCVPALAVLAGGGLDALAARAHLTAAHPVAGIVAAVAIAGALGIPSQVAYRGDDGHGDDIRLATRIVAGHQRPGDAVLYQPPWWRQIAAAYPYGFSQLTDVSLARTPEQAGNFTGVQVPVAAARERLRAVRRVWLVEFTSFRPDPVLAAGWTVIGRWHPSTFVLVLYQRSAAS